MRASLRRRRPPGWWIPWTLVAGFLLVVAVNGLMIWIAAISWTGLVTRHPYDRGLDYNRNLEAAAAMAALGWTARLAAARLPDGRHELRLEARDAAGEPLLGLSVEGRLERPVEPDVTRAVLLEPVGRGLYRAILEAVPAGQWQARLRLMRGDAVLLVSERLVLR